MLEKLADRFSFEDVISILAPGFVAMIALRLLLNLEISDVIGPSLSRDSITLPLVMIIAAYTVGLFLLEWVNWGTRFFLDLQMKHLARKSNPLSATKNLIWHSVIRFPVALLHGMPLPRMRRSFVEAQMMMCEFNESVSHTFEGSRFSSPWERLELFRKLIWRAPAVTGGGDVLRAAASLHSRLMFVLSLSLVLTLVDGVAMVQSVCGSTNARHASGSIAIVAAATSATYLLRVMAARYWEAEITLVCSLAERRSS